MPNERRYPLDETYSEWHRPASLARFMSYREAESLCYIDADWIEACPVCYRALLLVEAVRDNGQDRKVGAILRNLASDAGKPAVIVFYAVGDARQPAPRADLRDIVSFRVRTIWNPRLADPSAEQPDQTYTPERWAHLLLMLRRRHHEIEHRQAVA